MLPSDLCEMEPGAVMAAFLSATKDEQLSGYERIVVLQAYQRLASFFQAQVLEARASISDLINEGEADAKSRPSRRRLRSGRRCI